MTRGRLPAARTGDLQPEVDVHGLFCSRAPRPPEQPAGPPPPGFLPRSGRHPQAGRQGPRSTTVARAPWTGICRNRRGLFHHLFRATIHFRTEQIDFLLRLLGLRETIIDIPPPPGPPFDVGTMEPIEPPPGFQWPEEDDPDAFHLDRPDPASWESPQAPARIEDPPSWKAPKLKLGDERILVLDGDDSIHETIAGRPNWQLRSHNPIPPLH